MDDYSFLEITAGRSRQYDDIVHVKAPQRRMRYYYQPERAFYEWSYASYWNVHRRARRKGLEFAITIQDVLDLARTIVYCPLTGVRLNYHRGNRRVTAESPSLDWVVNSVGDVPDNLMIVAHAANARKRKRSLAEVLRDRGRTYTEEQVLAHLGSRNVLTLYPNRGAFVASPTVEEARQVFATRRVLEAAIVTELVRRLDDDGIAALRAHGAKEAAHGHDDRWDRLSLTGDFHALLGRLAGNMVLARFLEELVLRTSLIIAAFEPRGGQDCSPDAHPAIAERIVAGDREGACATMMAHLDAMERRLHLVAPPLPEQDIISVFAARLAHLRRSTRDFLIRHQFDLCQRMPDKFLHNSFVALLRKRHQCPIEHYVGEQSAIASWRSK